MKGKLNSNELIYIDLHPEKLQKNKHQSRS